MSEAVTSDALAICVAPGRFYGGRDYPNDIKYENRAESPIVPGDWVMLKLRLNNGVQTVVSSSKKEPGLTTIVHEGKIYLDVRVVFTKNELYSEDMDDYIFLPQLADVDEFEFDVTYALLVTWMDPAERNYCSSSKTGSGSKARWKLAVNPNPGGSTAGLPTSRMGYSFVAQKETMTLMGLIVGQDSNDKRRYYVWCPGCPLHYDGIVVEDPKCLLKIGKFIIFKTELREYNDVFVHREPRHFYILCYEGVEKPPCEVFVTNVTGDDRRGKCIIKMLVVDFIRKSPDLTRVSDGNVNGFIFTHNKILISDDKGLIHKVPEGHVCNFVLIRQKPSEPWMTQWRVHDVTNIRRPPPPKKIEKKEVNGAVNGVAEAVGRLSVETRDRPSPTKVARSKSVEVDGVSERRIESVPLPPPSPIPSTPPTPVVEPSYGLFNDLDHDEHIAFVEAYCNRNEAVYLWIVDDPQQAVIWGCKGKRKPLVGSFLRAYFKQQADGRLYCNMEDYEACGAPANIKVFDRSGHAIVRTDVRSEKNSRGEVAWMSKYLGLVEDGQRHMPRNVLDREKFTVQIGKRKQDKDFVWSIEQDVSKEQSHHSPQNGTAMRTARKISAPLRSPSSRANGSTNGINGHSGASSLNVTADELPLPVRRDELSSETASPPVLPSPGFDSRKTSIDEHAYSRPESRTSADQLDYGNDYVEDVAPLNAPFYHVNDDEWDQDSRAAREEHDESIQLVETIANCFLNDPEIQRMLDQHPKYRNLLELGDKL